jgi:hypothetical protein
LAAGRTVRPVRYDVRTLNSKTAPPRSCHRDRALIPHPAIESERPVTNATHDTDQHQSPDEGHLISRYPAWAERVDIGPEAIDYAWTAPTVPQSVERDGRYCPATVEITREDLFDVTDEGVVLDQGPERIFLCDSNFDLPNARRLIEALTEACDRLDGAR